MQVKEPGSYEVRLRWSTWGMLHRRTEVVALPADKGPALEAEFERAGLFVTRVGSVEAGSGVALA